MPSEVEFDFKLLIGPGWAEGRFAIGDRWVTATASYLGDALGEFLRAVRALTEGATEARASWDEEPGEYRWILTPSADSVRVVVLSFPEWRAVTDAPDREGRVLFDEECSLRGLVEAVVAGARRVLDEHGIDGYRATWVEHEFPEPELEALDRWLASGRTAL